MIQITTARQLFEVAVLESADLHATTVLASGATHIAMDEDGAVFTYKMDAGTSPSLNGRLNGRTLWLPGDNGKNCHYIGVVPEKVGVDYRYACFQITDDFAKVQP